MIRTYSTLDGKPIRVVLTGVCGTSIAGLVVERRFYKTGSSAPLLDDDALEVPDPIDQAIALARRWIQAFERQGFVIEGQYGGSVDAMQANASKLAAKRARGETVGWRDLPQRPIDRAELERGDAIFMVVTKRGDITRMVQVGRIMNQTKVDASEGQETCSTGARTIDVNVPEVVLRP